MADKTVKDGWSMLMKFGSEENLQKLQAGPAIYEKSEILCRFGEGKQKTKPLGICMTGRWYYKM